MLHTSHGWLQPSSVGAERDRTSTVTKQPTAAGWTRLWIKVSYPEWPPELGSDAWRWRRSGARGQRWRCRSPRAAPWCPLFSSHCTSEEDRGRHRVRTALVYGLLWSKVKGQCCLIILGLFNMISPACLWRISSDLESSHGLKDEVIWFQGGDSTSWWKFI